MILRKGTFLYRYSLGIHQPGEWSNDYHSPEYTDSLLGYKNQIGAFFFYFDENTALKVLENAQIKAKQQGNESLVNSITSCQVISDIELLDITGFSQPVDIIRVLYDDGIDVLTRSFICYSNGRQSFDVIRDHLLYIINNRDDCSVEVCCKIISCAKIINDFFFNCLRYTGQLLTDFENGKYFKCLLENKGYEGYLFDEEITSQTICLFYYDKITRPIHHFVSI